MSTVKTAISIDSSLFDQAEKLSQQLSLSRSQLFSIAVQEFIQRNRSRRMFDALNKAYADDATVEEKKLLQAIKRKQGKLSGNKW